MVFPSHQFSSLRFKIITSLLLVLTLSMGAALFGMWKYQQGKLLALHHEKALRTGHTIVAGLQYAMLQNNRDAVQSSLEEIAKTDSLQVISLIDKEGLIVNSSETSLIGRISVKEKDQTCLICHGDKGNLTEKAVVLSTPLASPILRTVVPIENKSACHDCHSAVQKMLGILVIDYSLVETYEILKTVSLRIIFTGLFTFIAIIALISFIITRFVSTPVQAFMEGIKKVESGDFKTWVDVKGSGEFAEMAVSFNVMIRALGRYLVEIKTKTTEIDTLYTIVKRMSETIDWKKIKIVLVDLLFEIVEAESVILCFPVEKQGKHFEVTWKEKGDRRHYHRIFHLDKEAPPHSAISREDLEQWLRGEYSIPVFTDDDTRVLIPLEFNQIQLGLIHAMKAKPQYFSGPEKKLLPDLSNHIAVSFANARLYNLATTDDLTTLYTKGFFETRSKEFEDRFHQVGEKYGILMIDLDHFKEVNDNYGHPVGDKVLMKVAELMRQALRHEDIPCRYGGEEFVILLPRVDIQAAGLIANRIRKRIANYTFKIDTVSPFKKTVSIGTACCPAHSSRVDELVAIADEALYDAKENGRNQVVILPTEENVRKIAISDAAN